MRENCFKQTGLVPQFLIIREYPKEVVDPLFESGLLPEKMRPWEPRKLVLRLWGGNWPSRSITLLHMAREVFEATADVSEDLRRYQRTVLLTRKAIFLANPEAAPGLGATARVDLFDVLHELLWLAQNRGVPLGPREHEVQRLVDDLEGILRGHGYPIAVGQKASLFKGLAIRLSARLLPSPTNQELVEPIRMCLERRARIRTQDPTFMDQFQGIVKMMRDWNYPQRDDGKLDCRIAITVSKADVLGGLSLKYDEIIAKHELPEKTSGRRWWRTRRDVSDKSSNLLPWPRPPQWWQGVLQKISNESEKTLIGAGEGAFIAFVKEQFSEVGFFFVSSLGRDTEVFVKEGPIRRPMQSFLQAQSPFGGQPQLPQAAGSQVPTWPLGKRVKVNPNGGGRAPAPQHVLLPLLWVLAGARP